MVSLYEAWLAQVHVHVDEAGATTRPGRIDRRNSPQLRLRRDVLADRDDPPSRIRMSAMRCVRCTGSMIRPPVISSQRPALSGLIPLRLPVSPIHSARPRLPQRHWLVLCRPRPRTRFRACRPTRDVERRHAHRDAVGHLVHDHRVRPSATGAFEISTPRFIGPGCRMMTSFARLRDRVRRQAACDKSEYSSSDEKKRPVHAFLRWMRSIMIVGVSSPRAGRVHQLRRRARRSATAPASSVRRSARARSIVRSLNRKARLARRGCAEVADDRDRQGPDLPLCERDRRRSSSACVGARARRRRR